MNTWILLFEKWIRVEIGFYQLCDDHSLKLFKEGRYMNRPTWTDTRTGYLSLVRKKKKMKKMRPEPGTPKLKP